MEIANSIYKCEICGKTYKTLIGLTSHISQAHHNITIQQYYDRYLKKENDGICIQCGNPTKFISINKGYKKYCNHCSLNNGYKKSSDAWKTKSSIELINIINKRKQTKKLLYDDENYNNREKNNQTNLQRYGVKNVMQNKEVQQKVKETNFQKYGKEYITQVDEIRNKIIYTKTHYTDTEKQIIQNNKIKSYINNLGVDNPSKLIEVRQKISDALKSDEVRKQYKQTSLKNNGTEHPMQNKNTIDKYKDTMLKNHGYDNPMKCPYILQRKIQTTKETWNNKTKNEINQRQLKINNTKRKNHSFNTSKIEIKFKNYLIKNNYNFIYQHKSELYPFNCDFYLIDCDMYIEINGYWTHGKHPFDRTNENDMQLLQIWKNKSITNNQYKGAIKTWTIRDPLKLKTAKENNLNYIAVYSNNIDEIINQFENYIKTKIGEK